MDKIELGKRIKEARLFRKMTQSELAGDVITRNMLSLIESGSASPSVKTLQYLAERLDVPYEHLLASKDEYEDLENTQKDEETKVPKWATPAEVQYNDLLTGKELYKSKKYNEVLEKLLKYTDKQCKIYDEACAIVAKSYYELARPKVRTERAADVELAKMAADYATKGIYADKYLRAEALFLVQEYI